MNWFGRAVCAIAFGALVVGYTTLAAFAVEAKGGTGRSAEGSKSPPTEMLFCVEFRGPCGPPAMPSFLGEKVAAALLKEGIQVVMGGQPPLVSRGDLKYSLVATQGETDLRGGRIFAEVGPGSELTFKNKEGKSVVLEIEVSQVCWDLDRREALARAREAKADRVILAFFQVEDMTQDVNPNGEFGKQKSVRVNLDLVRVSVAGGQEVTAFSEERRQMDISTEGAVAKAVKYLADKAAAQLRDLGETESYTD